MKPETRERLIAVMNHIAAKTGDGKDLHSSVSELMAFLAKLQALLAKFESPEQMREDLDKLEEPSPAILTMIEGTARHAPTLMHRLVTLRAALRIKSLPNPSIGRPIALPYERRRSVCDEVSAIERKGLSHSTALKRVAKRYNVNAQTIRRIWKTRSEYYASSDVTLDEAQDFLQTIAEGAVSNRSSLGSEGLRK